MTEKSQGRARTRWRQCLELLQAVLAGTQPADALVNQYFREHPQMGSRDRRFVGDCIFGILRHKEQLAWSAESGNASAQAEVLLARWFREQSDLSLTWLPEALQAQARNWDANPPDAPLHVTMNLPEVYAQAVLVGREVSTARRLMASLWQEAAVDLRVNTQKSNREELCQQLQAAGFDCAPCPYAAQGLRLPRRAALLQQPAWREGHFEFQDEGSQLISTFAAPSAGSVIIDYCAGSGGKSLHLADLMQGHGRIISADNHARRLGRLPARAQRAGVENIELCLLPQEKARLPVADLVLVDAPCSGSGSLRRAPDALLRQADLAGLAQQQLHLLREAAAFVKPGGLLVYATCSVFQIENEAVVEHFLQEQPEFGICPAPKDFPLQMPADYLVLTPDQFGTDGFFAARLRRN